MPPQPAAWRGIPAINPAITGARLNGRGLGTWRSVVPARSSRSGSGRATGAQGQPNDLERTVAERALNKRDEGFNVFNAGGKLLLGALDALDTPRAAVAAGVNELTDVGVPGEQVSFGDFVQNTRRNISMGEAIGLDDAVAEGRIDPFTATAAGFTLDVAADPLTYVGGGLAKVGPEGGQEAARALLKPSTKEVLGESAVRAAERAGTTYADNAARAAAVAEQGDVIASREAQKALKFQSNQMLSPEAREAIGATPGTFLNIPGKRLKIDSLVESLAPGRMVETRTGRRAFKLTSREAGLGRIGGRLRAKVTQGGVGNRMASAFTKFPELRDRILFGSPEDAATAFMGLEKRSLGDMQRRLFETVWGGKMDDLMRRSKKAHIDGQDLRYAVAEQMNGETAGPSLSRVLAQAAKSGDENLAEDLRAFFPDIQDAANKIDPELPWLMKRDDYTPNLPSDEMIALRGGWGGAGGQLRKDVFDFRQQYGLGEDQIDTLFGRKLKPPAEAGGKSVRQQIDEILTLEGKPNWFEQNAYKAFPDYVRRIAKRYGDEYMAKQLRDLGIFEASWTKILSEKGMTQGRAKAFIYQMTERANIRAARARERAAFTAEQGESAAAGAVKAERQVARTEQAATEADAIREYETFLRDKSATLGVQREALLSQIDVVSDDLFRLDHAKVELAHKIKLETYNATSRVTKLEARQAELRTELGNILDQTQAFDQGVGQAGIARQAKEQMEAASDRAAEIMQEMRRIDDVLHQFEDLADMPTDQLEQQLVRVDEKLMPLTQEYDAAVRAGEDTTELANKVTALSDLKASILHEKGVIERARGRIAEIDRSNPEVLISELEDVRNAEDMGDKLIHAIFPDLPEDINGVRIRDYFGDRMSELQEQIDATKSTILGAYGDRDSMRVELAQIRQQRREAQRNLRKVTAEVTPEERAIWEQQEALLAQADEAAQRAIQIDQERWTLFAQMGIGPHKVADPDVAARVAEGYLSAMHAKQLRLEAIALEAESKAATASKVQRTWQDIGRRNLSKPQEEALVSALKDSYRQVGAVSMTKDEWLVDGLRAATVLAGPEFLRPALKAYDKVLNLWKAYALSTPGTILRNLFGASFNNYLAGGVETAHYATTLRYLTKGKLGAADQAIFDQLERAGLFVGSGTTLEIERRVGKATLNPLSTDFALTRAGRLGQEGVESYVRGALAYSTMKHGGSLEDALARVFKYHFDYDDLSAFERSVMRRIVPFYTWTRKNFPLMLEQIVAQPQKFTRFYQLKNEVELYSPEEKLVPSYFTENMAVRMPFGLGSGQAYVLPDLPFATLNDVTDPSMTFSQMSPFLKTPIEYAFGQQVFKGIPLKDEYQPVPTWLNGVPGLMPALGALGVADRGAEGEWMMTQKNQYLVEQFIPTYGKARRLFPSSEKDTERLQSTWLSFLFGAGLRSNTPTDRRNEAYRRIDNYMEWVDTQKELGYLVPGEDKLPRFGQTVNAAYEYAGVERE